jgi:hypothetical protein
MRTNNFDQSGTGLNLELMAFRDTDRSRCDFEESFTRINDDLFVFTEFGNVSDDFSLSDFNQYKFTVKQLREAIKEHYHLDALDYANNYYEKSFYKLTKAELIEFVENMVYDSSEIAEFLQDNFDPLYNKIITRGYCQGDYAEVIITPTYKAWLLSNGQDYEKTQVKASIEKMVNHLFWDAPIYARLEINDNEFYLDEFSKDCYVWDKDQTIADFLQSGQLDDYSEDQKKQIAEFLQDNLPDYLDYN